MTHPPTVADDGVKPVIGGRFCLDSLLKRGVSTATWSSIDRKTGAQVIVKCADLSGAPSGTDLLLKHEAAVLASISHPCMPELIATCLEGQMLYLVMRRVEGQPLLERLLRGPIGLDDTLSIATCIFSALQAAHEQAVVHRDLKPSNIIVAEGRRPRATVIDFGFARSERLHRDIRDLAVGTACYTSPEQAGLIPHEVGERSDLYSAGIVLFECLAGRPPFEADSIRELLRKHLSERPPELRALGFPVPAAVDAIVSRLLRKDPRERYQSAQAVLRDLEAVRDALARGLREPVLVVGTQDVRGALTEPAFVGRQEELAALATEIEAARRGEGGLVLVESPSGDGKTRLLDEVASRAMTVGAWVLRGQSASQVARFPFHLLDNVAAELLATARREPAVLERVRLGVGDQSHALGDALPQLRSILEQRSAERVGQEAHGEVRSLRALTRLLSYLGTPERPAVVLLDDCQWADEMTLALLHHWSTSKPASGCWTLLVIAFRSEEVERRHVLRALNPALHLTLEPLSDDRIRGLVESMAGPLPDEVVATITRLCNGSPFMAAAVLRGMLEMGALVETSGGWTVVPHILAYVQSSRQAAAMLVRRIELLSADTREILSVAALLGKRFAAVLAMALSERPAEHVFRALDDARRRSLVWTSPDGTTCEFVHDKIRETLLASIPEDERIRLHRAAALRLQEGAGLREEDRAFELAWHFSEAGEHGLALPHAVRAAEHARARCALDIAEAQYRIAARAMSGADPALAWRIAEGLGDVLMLRGNYEEAARWLEQARACASDRVAQATAESKLGELAFKQGDMRRASEALLRGLEKLGYPCPRGTGGFLVGIVCDTALQIGHALLGGLLVGRRPLEGADDALLAVRLFSRLGYAWWFGRGALPALWAHLRELNIAESYPPTRELGQAYSNHAPAMTMLPWFGRALRYGARGFAVRRQLGDVWGQGQALHFEGVALFAASRYRAALEKFREAVCLLERTGDLWEVNAASYHVAFAHYRLGDLPEAVQTSRSVHEAGLKIGDWFAAGASLNIWSKASNGRVPVADLEVELARPSEDKQRNMEVLQAEGIRLIGMERYEEAAEKLEKARRTAHDDGLRTEYVASLPAWIATARRLHLEFLPAAEEPRRGALLRELRKSVARALRVGRLWRNNLPHALREGALLESWLGRPRRAHQRISESLEVARVQEARYEQAQSLQVRGRLGQVLGWPKASSDLREARALLIELGAEEAAPPQDVGVEPMTLSLADRFAALLETGRRIASALTREAVFVATQEAALSLLRAQSCLIVEVDDDELRVVVGEPYASFSQSLAFRAVANGCPTTFGEKPTEEMFDSILIAGVRSALCAPILVRGRAVACFYATHADVAGLFGETEERLAAFISTLAGAALENAEGFAAVQDLSRSLQSSKEELERSLHTLQQAQKQIVHTEKMALAGQLAGGIAHDFNNMLTVILACTEMLLTFRTKDDEDVLRDIQSAGRRAAALTRQLLAFSRRQVMAYQVLDLNSVITNMHTMLFRLIGSHIRLDLETSADLGCVNGDVAQLEQVVMNLVVNARDAMPEGGYIRLETANVQVTQEEQGWSDAAPPVGSYVRLQVSDTGTGMDADTKARIFEPFFSTKAMGKGTGLGLSTVYGIVQQSGGFIRVESSPGHGSRFDILLPRVEQPAASESAIELCSSTWRGSETILLVEDEEGVRTAVVRGLRALGYTVHSAPDGKEGMRLYGCHASEIDVLVTDIVMPGMFGTQLVARLKQHKPELKVIYVSGHIPAKTATPNAPFVQKPFTSEQLARKIRELCDGPAGDDPADDGGPSDRIA